MQLKYTRAKKFVIILDEEDRAEFLVETHDLKQTPDKTRKTSVLVVERKNNKLSATLKDL